MSTNAFMLGVVINLVVLADWDTVSMSISFEMIFADTLVGCMIEDFVLIAFEDTFSIVVSNKWMFTNAFVGVMVENFMLSQTHLYSS